MEHVLREFCSTSGQKVNLQKSSIWFSPNMPDVIRDSISRRFDVSITKNLGKYLGVPVIHGRMRKYMYGYLVEKVLAKLSGWKGKVLSRAARALLIQTVILQSRPILFRRQRYLPVLWRSWRKLIRVFFGVMVKKGKNHN